MLHCWLGCDNLQCITNSSFKSTTTMTSFVQSGSPALVPYEHPFMQWRGWRWWTTSNYCFINNFGRWWEETRWWQCMKSRQVESYTLLWPIAESCCTGCPYRCCTSNWDNQASLVHPPATSLLFPIPVVVGWWYHVHVASSHSPCGACCTRHRIGVGKVVLHSLVVRHCPCLLQTHMATPWTQDKIFGR
jgi:hypothetical protein